MIEQGLKIGHERHVSANNYICHMTHLLCALQSRKGIRVPPYAQYQRPTPGETR